MRKFFTPAILIFLPLIIFSQNKKPTVEKLSPAEEEMIFQKVTPEAGPVDPVAWTKYLHKNSQLPDSIVKQIPKGTYKVVVRFIVDTYGYIGQVEAINDPGFGLAERVVKMIRNYNIAWRPASACGRNVKAYRKETIVFTIVN